MRKINSSIVDIYSTSTGIDIDTRNYSTGNGKTQKTKTRFFPHHPEICFSDRCVSKYSFLSLKQIYGVL